MIKQLNERLNQVEGILAQRKRTDTGPSRAQKREEKFDETDLKTTGSTQGKGTDTENKEETRQTKRPHGPDSASNSDSEEDGLVLVEKARPIKKTRKRQAQEKAVKIVKQEAEKQATKNMKTENTPQMNNIERQNTEKGESSPKVTSGPPM
nr:uncharacterized protein LOC111516920 [Leptinotarsa decemlineata]